jgi:hypothetical protein
MRKSSTSNTIKDRFDNEVYWSHPMVTEYWLNGYYEDGRYKAVV